jgi:uncharacterized protein (DUF305 family)
MTSFEQRFIDMRVPHHLSAVEIAKIAADRAEHPEINTRRRDHLRPGDRDRAHARVAKGLVRERSDAADGLRADAGGWARWKATR